MRIELSGTDCPVLPGVTVGLHRRSDVVEERPADGASHHWVLDVDLTPRGDFTGPFVHGRSGSSFLYLS